MSLITFQTWNHHPGNGVGDRQLTSRPQTHSLSQTGICANPTIDVSTFPHVSEEQTSAPISLIMNLKLLLSTVINLSFAFAAISLISSSHLERTQSMTTGKRKQN